MALIVMMLTKTLLPGLGSSNQIPHSKERCLNKLTLIHKHFLTILLTVHPQVKLHTNALAMALIIVLST